MACKCLVAAVKIELLIMAGGVATNGKEDVFSEIGMAPHYCNTLLKAT